MSLPAALALLALAVALRLVPRLRWPDLQGTDAFYHLAYIRLIREQRGRLPRLNPRVLGPGEHTYPALFHWLLALAPPAATRWADRWGGLAADAIAAAALSAVLHQQGALDAAGAVAAAALSLLAPGLTLLHIGPRAWTLTPRPWAQTLFALAVALWLADANALGGSPATLLAAALALGLMLLTSKFGLQVLLLALPMAAAFAGAPPLLAAGAGSVLVALALFRGFFARQLRGQADHLRWYLRHNLGMLEHRRNWGRIAAALASRDPRRLAEEIAWHNPITSGLLRHAPLLAALVLAVARWPALAHDPAARLALALVAAALPAWLMTSFGIWRILGEAERYLEFAHPAAWALLWLSLPAPWHATAFALLAALFGAAALANLALLRAAAPRMVPAEEADIAARLRAEGDRGVVLLCLSDPESYYFLAHTDARLYKNGDLGARGTVGAFLPWFYWRYPWVHPDHLAEICARGGVTHLLENKRARERLRALSGRDYALGGLALAHENAGYRLYRVPAAGGGAAASPASAASEAP